MACGPVLCFQQLMHLAALACICILILKMASESVAHIALPLDIGKAGRYDCFWCSFLFCLNENQKNLETSQAFLQSAFSFIFIWGRGILFVNLYC